MLAIIPVLAGLIGITLFGANLLHDGARAAGVTADAVESAADASALAHEIDLERLSAILSVATGEDQADELYAASMERVDSLSSVLLGKLGSVDREAPRDGDTRQRQLEDLLAALRTARSDTSEATFTEDVYNAYEGVPSEATALAGNLLALSRQPGGPAGLEQLAKALESDVANSAAVLVYVSDAPMATDTGFADGLGSTAADVATWFDVMAVSSDPVTFERFRDLRVAAPIRNSDGILDGIADPDTRAATEADVTAQEWFELAAGRANAYDELQQELLAEQVSLATDVKADADRRVAWFVRLGALLGVVGLACAAYWSRRIVIPLEQLKRSAEEITIEELPRVYKSLEETDAVDSGLRFLRADVSDLDELACAAEAINALGDVAELIASKQTHTMKKGISEVFVSLAKRNQPLLDRQIEFIDRLEANEEDPDQLEGLYRLDHLATRMRRNAESLLVLAGSEPPRNRSRDVALADVVRVAVGEVEDFSRMQLLAIDDAYVLGSAAVDMAHMLAELMDNGAQVSGVGETVEVIGHRMGDGGYSISIRDRGPGMTAAEQADVNQLLAVPPAIGTSRSGSLGFVVVSTLAARHGIRVVLSPAEGGGVRATINLPVALITSPLPSAPGGSSTDTHDAALVVDGEVVTDPDGGTAADFSQNAEASPFAGDLSAIGDPLVVGYAPDAPPEIVVEDTISPFGVDDGVDNGIDDGAAAPPRERVDVFPDPLKLVEAIPEGADFEAGISSLLGPDDESLNDAGEMLSLPDGDGPVGPDREAADHPASDDVAPESMGEEVPTLFSELPKRERTGGQPSTTSSSTGVTASRRTPRNVQSVLSRYRRGLDAGRGKGAATPAEDETRAPDASPVSGHVEDPS